MNHEDANNARDEFQTFMTEEDLAELETIATEVLAEHLLEDEDADWPMTAFPRVGELLSEIARRAPDCFSQQHAWVAALRILVDMATAIALSQVARVDGATEDDDQENGDEQG